VLIHSQPQSVSYLGISDKTNTLGFPSEPEPNTK
jgi:hypothetical protein